MPSKTPYIEKHSNHNKEWSPHPAMVPKWAISDKDRTKSESTKDKQQQRAKQRDMKQS